MLRFGKTKVSKEECYGAKKPIKTLDVDVDNKVLSEVVQTNNNSKYLIEYLDKVMRSLVLLLPKMSGYIKPFKDKGGNKNKNNKSMSLCIKDHKVLQKCQTIWTKTEDLKNIALDSLPAYVNRYIKTKMRKYDEKAYTNFRDLNVRKTVQNVSFYSNFCLFFIL